MTDYSKIDWSKLPELPYGLELYFTDLSIPAIRWGGTHNPAAKMDGEGKDPWRYLGRHRDELEHTFVATKIIDRFIAEQEAELSKPKPRRVTPNELLVELIQTGKTVSLVRANEGPITLRWSEQGLYGSWSTGHHSLVDMRWLLRHDSLEVADFQVEPPKPRIPVKTKAPEGCRWDTDDGGKVYLIREKTGDVWRLPATIGESEMKEMDAAVSLALAVAYRELNP